MKKRYYVIIFFSLFFLFLGMNSVQAQSGDCRVGMDNTCGRPINATCENPGDSIRNNCEGGITDCTGQWWCSSTPPDTPILCPNNGNCVSTTEQACDNFNGTWMSCQENNVTGNCCTPQNDPPPPVVPEPPAGAVRGGLCTVDIGGQCNAINATCPLGQEPWREQCYALSAGNCSQGSWYCVDASAGRVCTYRNNECNPDQNVCTGNEDPSSNFNTACRQFNGNQNACYSVEASDVVGGLCEVTGTGVCQYSPADGDCYPYATSCGNGSVSNPRLNDACQSVAIYDINGCNNVQFSGDVCVEPDGWYCGGGQAQNDCIACFDTDCNRQYTIEYNQCGTCGSDDEPRPEDEAGNSPNPLGGGSCEAEELDTAIGCIPITGGEDLIGFVLGWSIGIAGGLALLLIVYAGIQILTSAGNPQKIQAGKELLGAAIGGFLFLLLSIYLLQFLGVDLLQIPGF